MKSKKFIPQYSPHIKKSYIKSVQKQMKSGWIGTSETTEEFEKQIQILTGKKYAISTTSGTMALFLGLTSLDIPKEKKIIFPSYTFLAGANVIKHLGYEIEFIDINKDTMCMDAYLLAERLAKDDVIDIGAIFFVNHNGYIGVHRELVRSLCDAYKIPMIEDSAQALGISQQSFDSIDENRSGAGTLGDFGIFSFSVPKLITTGQGGILFTDDENIAIKAKQLRDHGDNWRKDKYHKFIGLNLKFNDMAAALGLAQLENINELLADRKRIFDLYRNHIDLVDFGYDSTWMVIYKTNNIQQIINELKINNIQAVQYYRSIPTNPAFLQTEVNYPNAEYIFQHYLYLPSSLNLSKHDINRICKIIKKVEKNE